MAEAPQLSYEFRDFLVEAKVHGYGSEAVEKRLQQSGATEITYEDGEWLYTDNYVGGQPFVGYEHVSSRHPEDNKLWIPVWGMSYHGAITNELLTSEMLAELLGEVLSKPDPMLPVRGPVLYMFEDSRSMWGTYRLRGSGRLENFAVEETIGRTTEQDDYWASFAGGLVNRNPELEGLKPTWLVR